MTDRVRSTLGAGVLLAVAVGCSAGAGPWPTSGGSEGGTGTLPSASGNAGASAVPGSGGSAMPGDGASGASGAGSVNERPPGAALDSPSDADSGTPLAPGVCEQTLRALVEPPTVIVVADRSGSMFNASSPTGATPWSELRATLLALILALEGQVRFGLTVYSGDGAVCPELSSLPAELGQHAAIAALYGSLEEPVFRNGGPVEALSNAESALSAAVGARHVWLVTDGDVDYCDDGNPLCPVDSAIARLQRLAAASPAIRTTVFGPPAPASILASSALQAFANAGAAQPVALPATSAVPSDPNAIYDQCSGVPNWAADFASTGRPDVRGQSVGNYAGTGGSAVVHPPAGDLTALLTQLRAELVPERPCSFNLEAAGVPAGELASSGESAALELDGVSVDQDEQNGWRIAGSSTLQLEGASCAALRAAAAPSLTIRWSCAP
jgi:hypothetical protein